MAINRKPAADVDAPAAVASMNPDNMLSGGLKDDFDGLITKVRLVPWDYEGKIDHHILGVAVTIQPDGEDEFVQTYSAGELDKFVPSMDGKNPVDLDNGTGEELEGVYALRVGSKEQLNNNTNWAQFLGAALDAGFDKAKLTPAVTFLEGTYGHFNRIAQKKRSGIMVNRGPEEGAENKRRSQDILVITELKEAPAGAGKKAAGKPAAAAKTAAPKAAPAAKAASAAAASNGGGDLDDRLREVVTEAVQGADEGLPKAKLASLAIKSFQGAEKAKAIKRIGETDFLESSSTWTFDADSGTLYSNA